MAASHHPAPLLVGRLLRAAAGIACLVAIPFVPDFDLAWLAIGGLVVAGGVFLLAAAIANPGCEITAPVNVFLPPSRRVHCLCPLFTPVDRLERALRRHFA